MPDRGYSAANLVQQPAERPSIDSPPVVKLFFHDCPEARLAYASVWGPMPMVPEGGVVGAPRPVSAVDVIRLLRAYGGLVGDVAASYLATVIDFGHDAAKWLPDFTGAGAIMDEVCPFLSPVYHAIVFHPDALAIGSYYSKVALRQWAGRYDGSDVLSYPDSEVLDLEQPTAARDDCDVDGAVVRRLIVCGRSGRDAIASHRLATTILGGYQTDDRVAECLLKAFATAPRGVLQVAEAVRALRKFGDIAPDLSRRLDRVLCRPELQEFQRQVLAELAV